MNTRINQTVANIVTSAVLAAVAFTLVQFEPATAATIIPKDDPTCQTVKILSAKASTFYSTTTTPSKAIDTYTSTSWQAKSGVPQWIEVQLAESSDVWGVRLHVNQTPDATRLPKPTPAKHTILVGSTTNPTTQAAYYNQDLFNGKWKKIEFATQKGVKFVRIRTDYTPAPRVAWNEIQVCGQKTTTTPTVTGSVSANTSALTYCPTDPYAQREIATITATVTGTTAKLVAQGLNSTAPTLPAPFTGTVTYSFSAFDIQTDSYGNGSATFTLVDNATGATIPNSNSVAVYANPVCAPTPVEPTGSITPNPNYVSLCGLNNRPETITLTATIYNGSGTVEVGSTQNTSYNFTPVLIASNGSNPGTAPIKVAAKDLSEASAVTFNIRRTDNGKYLANAGAVVYRDDRDCYKLNAIQGFDNGQYTDTFAYDDTYVVLYGGFAQTGNQLIQYGNVGGYITYESPTQINVKLNPGTGYADFAIRNIAGQSERRGINVIAKAPTGSITPGESYVSYCGLYGRPKSITFTATITNQNGRVEVISANNTNYSLNLEVTPYKPGEWTVDENQLNYEGSSVVFGLRSSSTNELLASAIVYRDDRGCDTGNITPGESWVSSCGLYGRPSKVTLIATVNWGEGEVYASTTQNTGFQFTPIPVTQYVPATWTVDASQLSPDGSAVTFNIRKVPGGWNLNNAYAVVYMDDRNCQ